MNNAVNVVFSMENIWSRVYARLVNNKKEYLKKPSKPSFIAQKNTWQWFGINTQNSNYFNTSKLGNKSRLLFPHTDRLAY